MQKFKIKPKIVLNIEKKIQKQLKILNLIPKDKIINSILNKKHTYKSLCLDQKGNKYFFKARLYNEELLIRTFENEVKNTLFFSKNPHFFRTHKPIKWSLENDFSWILYKYFEGKNLLYSWNQNDIYNKIFLILNKIQKVPTSILPNNIKNFKNDFARIFDNRILKDDSDYEIIKKQILLYLKETRTGLPKSKIIEFIDNNKKILNQAQKVLVHGDLMMDNILLSGNNFCLIDFEYIQINYPIYDIVSLYNWAWNKPKWQKKLLENVSIKFIKNKKEFEILFRIVLILQSLYHLCYYNGYKPSLFKMPRRVFEFKIDIIQKSLKSFETLKGK